MKFKSGDITAPSGLDWEFTFGKYEGETIRYLLEEDPNYIIWCADNVGWFDIEAYIYDLALEQEADDEGPDEGDRFSIY